MKNIKKIAITSLMAIALSIPVLAYASTVLHFGAISKDLCMTKVGLNQQFDTLGPNGICTIHANVSQCHMSANGGPPNQPTCDCEAVVTSASGYCNGITADNIWY